MRLQEFPPMMQPRIGTVIVDSDRRQSSRHALMGTAEICAVGFPPLRGKIENISLSGCFVGVRELLPMNFDVTIRIDFGVAMVDLAGFVCRQEPGRGVAIQFRGSN